MSYECKICHNFFNDANAFSWHLRKDHNLTNKAYYDVYLKKDGEGICPICGKPTKYYNMTKGYNMYCGAKCGMKAVANQVNPTDIKCEICGTVIQAENANKAVNKFCLHLKHEHKIHNSRIYYDKFVKKEKEGICLICGKETEFKGILGGYRQFCSVKCQAQYMKNSETSGIGKLHIVSVLKEKLKATAEKVKEKYQNFLKNDKRIVFADIRTDRIVQKTISNTKLETTIDGDTVEIKTEISTSTQRDPWTGQQRMYRPKMESCDREYDFNDIIHGDSIDETEWCK